MSKIEYSFNIDEEDKFRFTLVIESRSVEAHSLMDSNNNKDKLKLLIEGLANSLVSTGAIQRMINDWKDKHKG